MMSDSQLKRPTWLIFVVESFKLATYYYSFECLKKMPGHWCVLKDATILSVLKVEFQCTLTLKMRVLMLIVWLRVFLLLYFDMYVYFGAQSTVLYRKPVRKKGSFFVLVAP